MRASSVGWELEINLTEQEIEHLEYRPLAGKIRVFDVGDGVCYGEKLLEVRVGEIDHRQLNVELRTEPAGVYIDKVERYMVILSPNDGYKDLRNNGSTGDRMHNSPGCKIMIRNESLGR